VPLPGLTPLLFLETRSRSKDPSSGADDTIYGTYRRAANCTRPGHSVADLSRERIKRRPAPGGLINQYERAA
jgi:hypothetical protein